jgi:hypothetical protein
MKRSRYERPPKASMVVDTTQGKILGWQRGERVHPARQALLREPVRVQTLLRSVAAEAAVVALDLRR